MLTQDESTKKVLRKKKLKDRTSETKKSVLNVAKYVEIIGIWEGTILL